MTLGSIQRRASFKIRQIQGFYIRKGGNEMAGHSKQGNFRLEADKRATKFLLYEHTSPVCKDIYLTEGPDPPSVKPLSINVTVKCIKVPISQAKRDRSNRSFTQEGGGGRSERCFCNSMKVRARERVFIDRGCRKASPGVSSRGCGFALFMSRCHLW